MSCDVGIVGVGVMGSSLALNIADKGFTVAVFDRVYVVTEKFIMANSIYQNLHGCKTIQQFKDVLKKPRRALILVTAGKPTDDVINQLSEVFEANDVIVDTGNAHFRDQIKRAADLESKGLRFLGMGISGGEEGARKGPAFFPGGTLSVWNDIKDIIEAAAAKAEDGRPCAVMNGKGGAGSCVKMYHNAGEYAILQIWGEVVAIMTAWGVPPDQQFKTLTSWKTKTGGKHPNILSSYMLDITLEVVRMRDSTDAGGAENGSRLLEHTMDKISSKGTGLWSVQEALGVGVPVPSLAMAVICRQMSMYRDERITNAAKIILPTHGNNKTYTDEMMEDLFWAVTLSIIASYTQMFQCLRELDKEFDFGLNLPATIATFRAGCILQGTLLKPMTRAFEDNPRLSSLLVAFASEIVENMPRYGRLISNVAVKTDAIAPVLFTSYTYIQTMLATSIPSAQCVALQRDVFGRHGFKRLDKTGDFSAKWPELSVPLPNSRL